VAANGRRAPQGGRSDDLRAVDGTPRNRPTPVRRLEPVRKSPAGGRVELGDHSPGRLHSPPRFPGPDFGRDLRRRCLGPAVQPLWLAPEPERRVAKALQALQVGRRLELPSERSLAEIVPLRQEPSPVVEARDLFSPHLVHQSLQGAVRCQHCGHRPAPTITRTGGELVGDREKLSARIVLRSHSLQDPTRATRRRSCRPTGNG
jgi:hypothetical protein